jgi:hypothetical protein
MAPSGNEQQECYWWIDDMSAVLAGIGWRAFFRLRKITAWCTQRMRNRGHREISGGPGLRPSFSSTLEHAEEKRAGTLSRRLLAIDPFMSVIVITARPDQYATAVAAGVGALIEKPLDLPFLLQKIEDLIRESAQERLARTSGRNPNLSYCPAPKKSVEWRSVGSGN